jgi:pyruvate dehydrogenase E1 component alpha subunit
VLNQKETSGDLAFDVPTLWTDSIANDFSTNPAWAAPAPSDADLISMLGKMQLIRQFEDRTFEIFQSGELAGTTHLCAGQEAVAVGVVSSLRDTDYIFSTFRNHGHALAKGVSPRRLMAEMYGRESGTNRGRGGSMHIMDASVGLLASGSIVGASPPLACGPALGSKLTGGDAVSVAFLGDGAMQQGTSYEAMNLAAIWKLPVIFVCENNGMGQATPIASVSPVQPYLRALAHGIPGVQLDGQDVEEVNRVAAAAVARARGGEGPTLIEARTYHYYGAWIGEPTKAHRDRAVDAYYRRHDPVVVLRERLIARGALSSSAWDDLADEIEEIVEDAIEFARQSAPSAPADMAAEAYVS